jgi:hypothetical protein
MSTTNPNLAGQRMLISFFIAGNVGRIFNGWLVMIGDARAEDHSRPSRRAVAIVGLECYKTSASGSGSATAPDLRSMTKIDCHMTLTQSVDKQEACILGPDEQNSAMPSISLEHCPDKITVE